ncbi:nucleotide sugar dehydrogenase [Alteromonas oceanisediminis]|uniref:nucleotide sugar dehydrogenase n=1 Tax=Alteromonas oceanisediminis TaxID=2836180 RepID=UPI001BDB4556|nr:UDP-glucose/GDP-mannose dehydrogenase family protein [Alteromonas oceanisediminis]MBT0585627.1 UDP-glucose/GDP-mannose dehydrogenase family protein [Alteromonas oceanisediminis]
MADISIIGLGYVGLVCAACQSNDGHTVIGIDVDPQKRALVSSGVSPIVEKDLDRYLAKSISNKRLTVSADIASSIAKTNITFVCVGTPSDSQGGLELKYIEQACLEIAQGLKAISHFHVVVIRSTVLPGTVLNVVKPLLEKCSGKRVGIDFGLATNPEFLREGTAIHDYNHPPMTVIGTSDSQSEAILSDLYSSLPCELVSLDIETAELVKYSCNAWHATKVAFANEIGSLAKSIGVDGRKVMKTVCMDKVLNISEYYMRPGFAFGGSCLPKDLRALNHEARKRHMQLPLLSAVLESNRKHIYKVFTQIKALGQTRIGLLGLSFKAGTDDLRESPLVELASLLTSKGFDVQIYDPNLNEMLSNDNGVDPRIPYPYLLRLLSEDMDEVIDFAEVVIIGNNEAEFSEVESTLPHHKHLLDLVGFMPGTSGDNKHGVCW